MSELIQKQTPRQESSAATKAQNLPPQDKSPTPTKPKDDPDTPPELELQETDSLFSNKEEMKESNLLGLKKPQTHRPRSKSQGNDYSILGFLEKKIRARIMSEQLTEKLQFKDCCL